MNVESSVSFLGGVLFVMFVNCLRLLSRMVSIFWRHKFTRLVHELESMVLLGLGSNQGESTEIMVEAIKALATFAKPGSLRSSRLWRTTPVDCPPDSADFINSAATFEAVDGLSPEQLLVKLKKLERQFGRGKKHVRNAPRELDLDLLLFGEQVRNLPDFVLPHPRAHNRLFVLQPAVELVPNAIWPETGKTIKQLLDGLQTDESVTPHEMLPPFYAG